MLFRSLRWLGAAERPSEHPLAAAILKAIASEGIEPPAPDTFEAVAGRGVVATTDGRAVVAGTVRHLADHGIATAPLDAEADRIARLGRTPVLFAVDGAPVGVIGIADVLKPTSVAAVSAFRALGLDTWMLTGDTAAMTGNSFGCRYANCNAPWPPMLTPKTASAGGFTCQLASSHGNRFDRMCSIGDSAASNSGQTTRSHQDRLPCGQIARRPSRSSSAVYAALPANVCKPCPCRKRTARAGLLGRDGSKTSAALPAMSIVCQLDTKPSFEKS